MTSNLIALRRQSPERHQLKFQFNAHDKVGKFQTKTQICLSLKQAL